MLYDVKQSAVRKEQNKLKDAGETKDKVMNMKCNCGNSYLNMAIVSKDNATDQCVSKI